MGLTRPEFYFLSSKSSYGELSKPNKLLVQNAKASFMHICLKTHQKCFKIWGPSEPAVLWLDLDSISEAMLK